MPSSASHYSIERVLMLPADIDHLVAVSQLEGFTFVERLQTEWMTGANTFALAGEAFFVARFQELTIGVCGLNRDPFVSDSNVARIRHLYVLPEYRRQSVGRFLMNACLTVAHDFFSKVRLRTFNPTADRFYRSLGFNQSEEEGATHVMILADHQAGSPAPNAKG